MSITFKYIDDLHYVKTQTEKGMGLLHSQWKKKQNKKMLVKNQNFQILRRKETIGFISFRYHEQYLFLDLMELDKRAQEQGVGRRVIRVLEELAKKRKKQAIYLYVLKRDHGAVSMYQRYGFSISDQGRDYWVMEKEIFRNLNHLEDKFLRIHFPL